MNNVIDNINPLQQKAFDLYQETIALIRQQAGLFLQLGQALKRIRDEKLYQYMGEGGFETFNRFLNNPEIGLRQSTAYLYIRIYEYYVGELKLNQEDVLKIGVAKLMRFLPALKKKTVEEAKELILNVGEMTVYDTDVTVRENKLEEDKPLLYRDKETGKFIFEYHASQMLAIINKDTGDIIHMEENENEKIL